MVPLLLLPVSTRLEPEKHTGGPEVGLLLFLFINMIIMIIIIIIMIIIIITIKQIHLSVGIRLGEKV